MRLSLLLASSFLMACAAGDGSEARTASGSAASVAKSSQPAVPPKQITDAEWQEVSPAVRNFLAAVRDGDLAAARQWAVDSAVAATAIRQQKSSPVVAAALAKEMKPASGGWDGDTLVAQFSVPGRSMPAYCYQGDQTDELQVHLRRMSGNWKVHRLAGRYC